MAGSAGRTSGKTQASCAEVKVIVTAQAQEEIDRAAAWHERRREGLGVDFFERIDEAMQRIEINPERYAARYKGLRRAGLRQFTDWGLWFQVRADHSLVIACLSGRRHPSVIARRVAGINPSPE
jgi:hypothetical protein